MTAITVGHPDAETAKAQLKAEFPAWSIIWTDTGKWWATRGPLTREELSGVADVSADTPEGLAEKIREVIRNDR
ncbi:hypothetical protein ACFOY4_20710 [Actinomadura syzygii]|uniref:Uncharacterized protein n=1 Tax=Actinomadura syzygii TaxID=1427538 RepID=A0A5D0U1T4_9ACTN|nr:hypothetical protein [Actinomadura syzygii]TYC12551.1 hypothetical protein FXF65_25345 [Actinomadura syzygii]